MTKKISIALAQLDFVVGDISGNTKLIIETSKKAKRQYNADLIVFPELSISGYPPEDLLLHSGFKKRILEASNKIQQEILVKFCPVQLFSSFEQELDSR